MIAPDAKSLFVFDPATVYLNHGGYGATPRDVDAAKIERLKAVEANPTRFFGAGFAAAKQEANHLVAARFGLRPHDIALVENITDGMNAVLRSRSFAPGDEILITSMVYWSVPKILASLARRTGAVIRPIALRFPAPTVAQFLEATRDALTSRTKLVILEHIAPGTALTMPVAEMTEICRAREVPVLVDGAHVPGNISFDISSIGADWYVANLHKWYFVPRGCGFLWAAPHRQTDLVPAVLSSTCDQPFPASFDWTGTRDPGPWLALASAFAFVDRFGEERLRRHNRALLQEGLGLLAAAFKTERTIPEVMTGSMGVVPLPDGMPYATTDAGRKQLEEDLWASHRITAGATFSDGERIWLRVSAQIYNELADYEKLARAIEAMRG